MKKNFFTIVIATFNDASLLHATLDSISTQIYSDFQLIIVDGGSSDHTSDVVSEFREVVDIFLSEPDLGIYDAWNKALMLHSGQWICFVGSGDILHPNFLNTYRKIIDTWPGLDFLSCRARLLVKHNHFRAIGGPFDWDVMRHRMSVLHVGAMHHCSLFAKRFFSLKYKVASDYDFLLYQGKSFNTLFVDALLLDMLPGGISQSTVTPIFESFMIKISHKSVSLLSAIISLVNLLIRFYVKVFLRSITAPLGFLPHQ